MHGLQLDTNETPPRLRGRGSHERVEYDVTRFYDAQQFDGFLRDVWRIRGCNALVKVR
jgi:hypothetical protein